MALNVQALNMEKHVSALVKSCFAQIRTIGRIKPYLSESACKTLVATLVTSRIDYGNAILYEKIPPRIKTYVTHKKIKYIVTAHHQLDKINIGKSKKICLQLFLEYSH
jgi:hypothetical protein